MLRVLLASDDEDLVENIRASLLGVCQVEMCKDGDYALELLRVFDPDVMMIDTRLAGTDAITVIRTARASLRKLGILVVTTQRDACTERRLAALNVNYILIKPCKVNAVVSQILDVGGFVRNTDTDRSCLEREVDSILLDLGFRMGLGQYSAVKQAVLAKFYSAEGTMMKDIYYQVAKVCGGTSVQKEKAIRDGIKVAVSKGDFRIWQLYFLPFRDGQWRYPTNEEFISRISNCLRSSGRGKLPYGQNEERAM